MTYLDHQIFLSIRSELVGGFICDTALLIYIVFDYLFNHCREFLGQAWMKADKKFRAEHIIQMTKRFNDGSRLVSSEIISR